MNSISEEDFGSLSTQNAFLRVAFKGVFIQNSEAYLIGNGLSPRSLTIKSLSFRLTSWNTFKKIMNWYKINLLNAVSYILLSVFFHLFIFIIDLNFLVWKVQRFPIHSLPPHTHSLPNYQHPSAEWVHLLQWMNLHCTSQSPKSIVSIRVHSRCRSFCEFGQIYKEIYLTL